MLNISRDHSQIFIGHGYHTNERGRKYVRIYRMDNVYHVKVALEPHKDLHCLYDICYPYNFTDSFMILVIDGYSIPPCRIWQLIDEKLNAVWFEG